MSPLADTPVDELARLPFHLFRLSLLFVCVPVCAFVCRDSASLSLRMLAVLSGSPSFPLLSLFLSVREANVPPKREERGFLDTT